MSDKPQYDVKISFHLRAQGSVPISALIRALCQQLMPLMLASMASKQVLGTFLAPIFDAAEAHGLTKPVQPGFAAELEVPSSGPNSPMMRIAVKRLSDESAPGN